MNKDRSALFEKNTWGNKNILNLSNHVLGACFRPYKVLFNLHTREGYFLCLNPVGWWTYAVTCKTPFKNAFLTSNWTIFHLEIVAMMRISLIVESLTTGEKVSVKSTPFLLVKSFCNQVCLEFVERVVSLILSFEYPLYPIVIFSRTRHHCPHELKPCFHGFDPTIMF